MPYLVPLVVGACLARRWAVLRECLRGVSPVLAVVIALLLFVGSHVVTGRFQSHYLVPAVCAFLPIVAIGVGRLGAVLSTRRLAKIGLGATLLWPLLVVPLRERSRASGGALPIERIREVAGFVAHHSRATDRVLALEALYVAVEANRMALPGLSMGRYSYWDMGTQEATALNVVNQEILTKHLACRDAPVVILTEGDWQMLETAGVFSKTPADADRVRDALLREYRLALVRDDFGHRGGRLFVYLAQDVTGGHHPTGAR
jgi:hypothetical protein